MEIGDRIKRERTAAGLTQEQLAARIGVDKSAVGQWESVNSRKGITTQNLLKVADALAIPVNRLTGDDSGSDRLETTAIDEIEIVRLFRQMSADQQDIHLRLFRTSVGLNHPRESQRHPSQRKRITG